MINNRVCSYPPKVANGHPSTLFQISLRTRSVTFSRQSTNTGASGAGRKAQSCRTAAGSKQWVAIER